MPKLKPISIEAYRCPKCKTIIEGIYKKAKKHVDINVDRPLPTGFTYLMDGFANIIMGKGEISRSEGTELEFTHSYIQPKITYSFKLNEPLRPIDYSNSRTVRKWFKEGRAGFLPLDKFKIVKEYYKDYPYLYDDEKPLRLRRTTPSLKRLVNEDY